MTMQNILRPLILVLFAVILASDTVYSQDFECNYTQITDTVDSDTRSVSTNLDGSAVVFVSDQDFAGMNADGNLEVFLYEVFPDSFTQITDTIGLGNFNPSMSSTGSLFVFKSTHDFTGGNPDGNAEIFMVSASTLIITQLTNTTGGGIANSNTGARINADGTHIAFLSNRDHVGMNADGNKEVFILDINTLIYNQITDTTVISHNDTPAISADGTQVSFQSEGDLTGGNADSSEELFLYDANTDTITQVTDSTGSNFQSNRFSSFSPDGTLIAFKSNLDLTGENPAGNEIFVYDIHTDSLSQITTSIFPEGIPRFSADGNYIIFSANNDITGGNSDFNDEIFLYDISADRFLQYSDTIGGDSGISASLNSDITFAALRTTTDITGGNPDESFEIFIADCIRIFQNNDSSGGGGCSLAASNNSFADLSLLMFLPALLVLRRLIF